MFAFRARSSAIHTGHPAPHAQSLPSYVACNSRADRDENRVPSPSTRRALFVRSFTQERKLTPLPSMKRVSSRLKYVRQPIYLQLVADSLKQLKIVTPTFPTLSTLFARSFTKERKSTPLLSSACALFVKTTRGRGIPSKPNPCSANKFRGCYSRSAKKSEGLSEQP
jgi:hypothetical protein